MENQVNVGDQNKQQIGQNPVNQPVVTQEKPKTNYLMIGVIILACFVLFGFGGYYVGKLSSVKKSAPDSTVTQTATPTPTESLGSTAEWTSYNITPDASLGYISYTLKLPASWKQIEHSSNFQDTETFQDAYSQFTYQLIIHQQKNYNEQTGKPYITLKELTGFPYDVTTLIVDGQQAARVLPRAGSESIYKVLFFSKDTKLVISIELVTPRDGSKVKEGETLFNQILSTFKFLGSNETAQQKSGFIQGTVQSEAEAYVVGRDNISPVANFKLDIFEINSNKLVHTTDTDKDGKFTAQLPPGDYYFTYKFCPQSTNLQRVEFNIKPDQVNQKTFTLHFGPC